MNLDDLTMTDKMVLLEMVEQASDDDFVRKMLAFAAGRMMDMEAEARIRLMLR